MHETSLEKMVRRELSGMSREMMEMDGRDSAECQNWRKKGIN